MEYWVVCLLVIHYPVGLWGDVDIYLQTGGAKQCQATIKRAIRPIVDYASPYAIVKIPPLSWHSQKFSITILDLTVNVGMMFRSIRQLTGTLDGNALFVICLILLMEFIAARTIGLERHSLHLLLITMRMVSRHMQGNWILVFIDIIYLTD